MRLSRRLARALGVDGNPLRRASDQAEAWLRAGLLVAFLTVGPIAALTAAQWATHATGTETSAQPARGPSVLAPDGHEPCGAARGRLGLSVAMKKYPQVDGLRSPGLAS